MPTEIVKGKYWDKSLNPIEVKGGGWHCTKASAGCLHCWAEQQNLRFGNKLPYDNRPIEFVLNEKILQQPLRRKIPTTYFVCNLCDLFHEKVPFEFINKITLIMAQCSRHTFRVLTKRPEITLEHTKSWQKQSGYPSLFGNNTHLGVSISTQAEADEKIPIASQIPGFDWVSFEPLLEDIPVAYASEYKWAVIGCESINGWAGRFRECEGAPWVSLQSPEAEASFEEAAINLVRQCKAAGVPVFVKQIPLNGKVSKNMAEWPIELRVQEMPDGK